MPGTPSSRSPHDRPAMPRCLSHEADMERVARATEQLLPEETYFDVAETFRALADSTRAKIVYSLLRQELCTCDLAAVLGISESAVSQHLRVLRQLRLTRSERRGKQVFYTLDDQHIRVLLAVALSHVKHGDQPQQNLDNLIALFEQEG